MHDDASEVPHDHLADTRAALEQLGEDCGADAMPWAGALPPGLRDPLAAAEQRADPDHAVPADERDLGGLAGRARTLEGNDAADGKVHLAEGRSFGVKGLPRAQLYRLELRQNLAVLVLRNSRENEVLITLPRHGLAAIVKDCKSRAEGIKSPSASRGRPFLPCPIRADALRVFPRGASRAGRSPG